MGDHPQNLPRVLRPPRTYATSGLKLNNRHNTRVTKNGLNPKRNSLIQARLNHTKSSNNLDQINTTAKGDDLKDTKMETEDISLEEIEKIIHTPNDNKTLIQSQPITETNTSSLDQRNHESQNTSHENSKADSERKRPAEFRSPESSSPNNQRFKKKPYNDNARKNLFNDHSLPTDPNDNRNDKDLPSEYDINIQGPYKIYLQSIDNDRLDAIKIAKSLIPKIEIKDSLHEIKQLSYNKVCVIAKYRNIANLILNLTDWKDLKIRAFIPNHLLSKQGIIKGIPVEITDDELKQFIELDSPFGPLQITHTRRFTKKIYNKSTDKVDILPTKTVQITVKGQFLPAEAKVLKVIYPIETYYPQVRQCYRCFRFGHIKNNCKAPNERCIRCGEPKHTDGNECPYINTQPTCLHCKQNHLPIDKSCPAKIEEQNLKNMATDQNITIAKAAF
ncbi:uncharacterized protein LOC100680327 [Nasonia vitripennis]|uniref:CCHC-type domain-containing protein n=1 Tax=Nasonia vitripennis TaxID=7425 RepID=A0A7M7QPK8_NASVI|nr:uncharacterized protein LOC100680327 [Nasonia vitripennis]XP_031788844.1 uncharacterized protein LOC100680327 [Nasonia vitripennis]